MYTYIHEREYFEYTSNKCCFMKNQSFFVILLKQHIKTDIQQYTCVCVYDLIYNKGLLLSKHLSPDL